MTKDCPLKIYVLLWISSIENIPFVLVAVQYRRISVPFEENDSFIYLFHFHFHFHFLCFEMNFLEKRFSSSFGGSGQNLQNVEKLGWLTKQGGVVKNWKRFYSQKLFLPIITIDDGAF